MNPNAVFRVIAITPKPEKLEEALAQGAKFAKIVEDSEPDCLMYKVLKTKPVTGDGPKQIIITVAFKDEAAFKAHEESAHVQAYKADSKAAEFLAAPPDVRAASPAGGFTRI